MDLDTCITTIADVLQRNVPTHWDGKASILGMRDAGDGQWRQMEWIGWYFQYLCNTLLAEHVKVPGPRYGNTSFDAFLCVPWDFKAHAKTRQNVLIVNDTEAILRGVAEYGSVGLIVATGDAEYDDEQGSFRSWHDQIKGSQSWYVRDRILRGARSRRRKAAFTLTEIHIAVLDEQALGSAGTFQKGFRNADGSPRRSKVTLRLSQVENLAVRTLVF